MRTPENDFLVEQYKGVDIICADCCGYYAWIEDRRISGCETRAEVREAIDAHYECAQ